VRAGFFVTSLEDLRLGDEDRRGAYSFLRALFLADLFSVSHDFTEDRG
jgi:hypothetical protein